MTFCKPHLLLLDEPTNHLDIDTVDALIEALNMYSGGVLIISHDEHLISQVCDEIWVAGAVHPAASLHFHKRSTLLHQNYSLN